MAREDVLRLEGDRRLRAKLRRLPSALSDREVRRILGEAAGPMAATAAANVTARSPGGPTHGDKHLADSMTVQVVKDRGRFGASEAGFQARIGPGKDQWHGPFIEYGFTDRAGTHHAAQPFMRTAFDGHVEPAKRHIIRGLWALVEKEARRP